MSVNYSCQMNNYKQILLGRSVLCYSAFYEKYLNRMCKFFEDLLDQHT